MMQKQPQYMFMKCEKFGRDCLVFRWTALEADDTKLFSGNDSTIAVTKCPLSQGCKATVILKLAVSRKDKNKPFEGMIPSITPISHKFQVESEAFFPPILLTILPPAL